MRPSRESAELPCQPTDSHDGGEKSREVGAHRPVDSRGVESDGRRHVLKTVAAVGLSTSLAGCGFTDGGGDAGPEIESIEAVDTSNPAWTRYETRWDVSSEGADLASVTTELRYDGEVIDSAETSVSGSTASGEHHVRTWSQPEDDQEASTVRLVVVDEEGRRRGRSLDATDIEGEDVEDEDEDDGMPGPGLFTTLASIGGASYLLARLRRDDAA